MIANLNRMLRASYRQLYRPWQLKVMDLKLAQDEIVPQGNRQLYLKRFDLTIDEDRHAFFIERISDALLLDKAGGTFVKIDNILHFQHGEYDVLVKSLQDMSILRELFWGGGYNFDYAGDVVVCDIGMNVGLASLFFAQRQNVKAVYGFEPFVNTYNDALANIALNAQVKDKIHPYNYGIAGSSRDVQTIYTDEYRGGIGIYGRPANMPAVNNIENVTVRVEGADQVVEMILREMGPDCALILKVDCEGAEYEIVEQLSAKNLLNRITGFMFEWHEKGPLPLTNTLKQHGFLTLAFRHSLPQNGMCYAFRVTR